MPSKSKTKPKSRKKNPIPKAKVVPKDKNKEPTDQQWLFIHEYVKDFRARAAAIRAGYSAASAHSIANRLLKEPHIRHQIDNVKQALTDAADVTTSRIIQELKMVGFSNILDFVNIENPNNPTLDLTDITDEQAAAIESMEVDEDGNLKIKFHGKLRALEALGRYKKMFTDKVEVTDTGLGQRLQKARERRGKKDD